MVHYLRFDWIQLELVDKKCNFGVKYKAMAVPPPLPIQPTSTLLMTVAEPGTELADDFLLRGQVGGDVVVDYAIAVRL